MKSQCCLGFKMMVDLLGCFTFVKDDVGGNFVTYFTCCYVGMPYFICFYVF